MAITISNTTFSGRKAVEIVTDPFGRLDIDMGRSSNDAVGQQRPGRAIHGRVCPRVAPCRLAVCGRQPSSWRSPGGIMDRCGNRGQHPVAGVRVSSNRFNHLWFWLVPEASVRPFALLNLGQSRQQHQGPCRADSVRDAVPGLTVPSCERIALVAKIYAGRPAPSRWTLFRQPERDPDLR